MISRTIKQKTQKINPQWLFIPLVSFFLGFYTLFVFKFPSKWIPFLLLAGIFPFVVLVVGNLKKILIILILLDIPFQLDIALGSYWFLDYTGVINGYIISVTTICLAALYVLWILEFLVKKDTVSIQTIQRPNLYLTLYLAITCLSLVFGHSQKIASFEIFLLVQMFLMYFYLINKIRKRDDLLFIMVILLIGLISESLIIMLMQLTGQGFSLTGIKGNIYSEASTPEGFSRIGGTLISANAAGSYLSLLLVPGFSFLLTKLNKPYKLLAIIAFITGVIALILTGSRGAWIATFTSFILFGFVAFRKGWLASRIVIIGAVIGIFISLLFYTPIYQRIFGYDAGAAAGRVSQYQVAFEIIKNRPIFGVGANNYPFILQSYLAFNPDKDVFRWAVHNKYLLVWAETGLFGLLFFVLFLLSTIRQGFKITQIGDRVFSPLALGFTTAVVGHMVHMFFDVFHGRSQVQLLWLVAALIMVLSYLLLPVKLNAGNEEISRQLKIPDIGG